MHTVRSLRENGFKVRVYHVRRHRFINEKFEVKYQLKPTGMKNSLCCNGGETHVSVTTPQGRSATGIARCMNIDPYNKKEGVKYALDRAIMCLLTGNYTLV